MHFLSFWIQFFELDRIGHFQTGAVCCYLVVSAPRYINISSNHPRSVLRQIPNVMNQMINRLSSCKRILEDSKGIYDDALKNSGFQGRLEYLTLVDLGSRDKCNNGGTRALIKVGVINNNNNNNSHSKRRGKNRNRKFVWFNPPF